MIGKRYIEETDNLKREIDEKNSNTQHWIVILQPDMYEKGLKKYLESFRVHIVTAQIAEQHGFCFNLLITFSNGPHLADLEKG